MNNFEYETRTVKGMGVHAYLRTAGDGELKPILAKGGAPKIYPNKEEAIKDILDNLVSYVNGNLVRSGEIAGATMAEAEAAFKPILRQKGKTRLIAVSYKGQGRKCRGKPEQRTSDELSADIATAAST